MNITSAEAHRLFRFVSIIFGHLTLVSSALAQHYWPGLEGIRAATTPPPGIYLRDYNAFNYDEHNYNTLLPQTPFPPISPYSSVQTDVKQTSYLNEPRLIWITNLKLLGADYGMALIVPFGYVKNEYSTPAQFVPTFPPVILPPSHFTLDRFGLGDVEFEPLLLGWHFKHFDFTAGYGIWAPTGDFDANTTANIGLGCWSHMITAGATWYPDDARSWAVSVLNHYEINQEQEQTGVTYPQVFTMEWGVSKSVFRNVDIGIVGYWSEQLTDYNGGPVSSPSDSFAIGPEISASFPKLGLAASLRYLHAFQEMTWQNIPHTGATSDIEGNKVVLTLTKQF